LKLKLIIIIVISAIHFSFSQSIISPFNHKAVNLSDQSSSAYSFLAFGHWYGSEMNTRSLMPSSTILTNIDNMNNHHPAFIMALGDIYRQTDTITLSYFKSNVINKISSPLFNAVGNHEIEDASFYQSNFGSTFYSFQIKKELYIVLNSEMAACELEGEQLNFLKTELKNALNSILIKNVFIFSHKLMWITLDEKFSHLYPDYECYNKTNFKNEIYPQLLELSLTKYVYFLSGDCGISLFYHKVKDHELTFLSCAINDSENDAFLKINISDQSNVNIEAHSFVEKKLHPLETFTIDYWMEQKPGIKPVTLNTMGEIQSVITHKYFWSGVAASLIIILIVITFLRLKQDV
jgi:hypothetical protein